MGLISLLLGVTLILFWMMYVSNDTSTTVDTNMLEQRLNTEKTVDNMVNEAVPDSFKDVLRE
jgi:hypothetical protein